MTSRPVAPIGTGLRSRNGMAMQEHLAALRPPGLSSFTGGPAGSLMVPLKSQR